MFRKLTISYFINKMNKTNEGERYHRVYSNLVGPLDIIGRDCDHGNVESKNTSKRPSQWKSYVCGPRFSSVL
jgi:hypothetical protein